jgi:arsenite methyltransferase
MADSIRLDGPSATGMFMDTPSTLHEIQDQVQTYYGTILQHSDDLKTNACCAAGAPPPWMAQLINNIHPDVLDQFYGCGFPIPEALTDACVLDLGCGTGRDVYIISQLLGEHGHVHGVDMTPSQLEVGQRTLDWHRQKFGQTKENVSFHQAYIEDLSPLDLADASVDVVVSNCVVNLSPRKDLVLKELFALLKPGGEFYFSDVFVDRRLPEAVATDPILYAECLGGAMYGPDFIALAKKTGFLDPRVVSESIITIQNDELSRRVGAARFHSVTLRLFKLHDLEPQCEDYGQIAIYNGEMPHVGPVFQLDDHHLFEANRPERVCGNTAAMLQDTRYSQYFTVIGERDTHYGAFVCGETLAAQQYAEASAGSSGCC